MNARVSMRAVPGDTIATLSAIGAEAAAAIVALSQTKHWLTELDRTIEALRASELRSQAASGARREPSGELSDALRTLQAAREELRLQNDDLAAARAAVDEERRRYRDLFDFAPDAYLVTDMDGVIREANRAAAELVRRPLPALIGNSIADFLRFHERQPFASILRHVVGQGRIDDWRLQLRRRDRPALYLAATVAVTDGTQGASGGLRWLLHDVTERTRVEAQVRDLNQDLERRVHERTAELERANAAKDEFLGLVSHELKTPITTIMGNAEVLHNHIGQIDAESRDNALADIRQEADRLHHIIDNMLVLARLEGDQQVSREPVMLQRIIREIAARHRGEHPRRNVIVRMDEHLPPIDAAPLYIGQVLRNLLSNAEKYSPADEAIEVQAVQAAGQMEVRVLDNGSAPPADEVAEIFRPFYRSPRTAGQAPGVGIGLAVCKRLVEALGGSIWAAKRPAGGLEIGFSLPVLVDTPEDSV